MNNQRKGLLPTNVYPCTVRQSYKASDNKDIKAKDDTLVLCWTVNSDDSFAWHNIIKKFDIESDLDMWNLQKMAETLNFKMYDKDHPEFYDQWVGLNARLNITVDLTKGSNFKRNIILEYMLPKHEPEIDVLKEKDDSHFYTNKHERQLPI